MSAVPRQVKAQADKAREAIDQIKKAQQEAGAAAEAVAASHATPPAPTPAAAPSEPAPPPQPPSQQPQPPSQQPQPLDEDWKHKYEVLQGKYSAEVPAMAEELRRTRGMLERLQAELEELRKAPPTPASTPDTTLIKPEEIDEFGPELYDFVRRVARAEVLPELETRLTPVKKTAETAANTVVETARARFMASLNADPDFHRFNTDKGFLQWLAQKDPLAGVSRQELLDQAVATNDVDRTLAFFKAYKATVESTSAPSAVASDPRPTPADFVTPGGTPPAMPGTEQKKIWSKAEIDDFFQRTQRKTQFSHLTSDEAAKVRAEIMAATAEGRVKPV